MAEKPEGDGSAEHGRVLSDYVSADALANELGVSVDTLRRWEAQRKGPPMVKLGAKVFYRIEAVRKWARERETAALGQRRQK